MKQTKNIAIQGIKGSNHYLVAKQCFDNNANIQEFLSFDSLVESLKSGKSDFGIMAIENSIAGSIIPNYALIDNNNLHIVGEYYLNIHHHLMALPNQKIDQIKEVSSHPMALLQCVDFFKKYPHIKLIEYSDTAKFAKYISINKTHSVAAIAPKIAAELYKLEIIEQNIQTIKNNATRFVILQNNKQTTNQNQKPITKASLKFILDHKRGSLAAVLNVMSDCNLNLTKIQSLPKIDTPWKYAFFVDVTFSVFDDYKKAITIIKMMAQDFKILGQYNNERV